MEKRIGFVLVVGRDFSGTHGFIGAYMVTNEKGYPQEFRITTPVKPTAIQRAIYGDELHAYVSQELVAAALLKDAEVPVELIVIQDGPLRTFVPPNQLPLAILARSDGVTIGVSDHLQRARSGAREIAYEAPLGFEVEIQTALEACARHFDPQGAFTRMQAAVDVLVKEDERFR